MYALNPSATGANAIAAMPPDKGMTEPMLTSPVIGALAAAASEHLSVGTVHAAPEPPPVSPVDVWLPVSAVVVWVPVSPVVVAVPPAVVADPPDPAVVTVVAPVVPLELLLLPQAATTNAPVAARAARRRRRLEIMDSPLSCGRRETGRASRCGCCVRRAEHGGARW